MTPFAFFHQPDTFKSMIYTILNMIPSGSIFKKKRSWLYAAFAVIGAFFFIAAKQAPKDEITIVPQEKTGITTIIFDLGDVIFETSRKTHALIFLPVILKNPMLINKLFYIDQTKQEYFDILSNIPATANNPVYNKGKALPLILSDWQSGLKTSQEIKKLAVQAIEKSAYSNAEKNLFYGITNMMFIPENLANSQLMVLPMAKLLKKFKEAGYRICVLSNWDESSFKKVHQKHPKLFALCDEIFISGKEKVSKPNPEFYKKLLNKLNLKAEECVFIDDELF